MLRTCFETAYRHHGQPNCGRRFRTLGQYARKSHRGHPAQSYPAEVVLMRIMAHPREARVPMVIVLQAGAESCRDRQPLGDVDGIVVGVFIAARTEASIV